MGENPFIYKCRLEFFFQIKSLRFSNFHQSLYLVRNFGFTDVTDFIPKCTMIIKLSNKIRIGIM